eukprot:scaffold21871_cov64-Phaeocystis_antarctica.AAC.7
MVRHHELSAGRQPQLRARGVLREIPRDAAGFGHEQLDGTTRSCVNEDLGILARGCSPRTAARMRPCAALFAVLELVEQQADHRIRVLVAECCERVADLKTQIWRRPWAQGHRSTYLATSLSSGLKLSSTVRALVRLCVLASSSTRSIVIFWAQVWGDIQRVFASRNS